MKMKILAVTTLAMGAAVFAGNSNAADTATGTSTATVVTPIEIIATAPLAFGSFVPGAAGGTVTVSTSGVRTASGAVLSTVNSAPTAAKFDVTGAGESTYGITVADEVTLNAGAELMTVATFSDLTAGGTATENVTSGTLTDGTQSIYVGGTLTVADAQLAGAYTGTFTVSVEYN